MNLRKTTTLVLLFVIVCLVQTPAKAQESPDAEFVNDSNESGGTENYTSRVTEKDKEENVEIFDKNGNLVTTIFVTNEEGYEIEKPEDREVCLVKERNENNTCFEETPVKRLLPKSIWDKCTGREVLILQSIECGDEEKAQQEETSIESGREKRWVTKTCCVWHRTVSRYCRRTYCCKRGWFSRCIRYCCSYGYRTYWSQKCVRGYSYRFYY